MCKVRSGKNKCYFSKTYTGEMMRQREQQQQKK